MPNHLAAGCPLCHPVEAVTTPRRSHAPRWQAEGVLRSEDEVALGQRRSPPSIEEAGFVASATEDNDPLRCVCIFANKYTRIYATHCASPTDAVNTHSINACNVLALS
ncbi:hypothetical protein SETIT_9G010900v2 [Setaria italica]|uniref:Uncharacterized protein n=1 Tax=Setaria italica TaxID=4555 RepID=A0A368SC50_SETIT|nr:hypothetical protein SETIT_9G010900v2 [Setaria italica]